MLLYFVSGKDPYCQILSPDSSSCAQCQQNFEFDQFKGICISNCSQNLYLETEQQQCVPSCKYNEIGYSNQRVCKQLYQCPILADLGQDFHAGYVSQIIVDNENQIIISISQTDTNIKLWNQEDGILKTTFSGHTQPVLKIYLLKSSNQLLSFSSSGEIFYWNYSTGVLNLQQIINQGQLTSLSTVNLNYNLIALYGYQGEFYIYDMSTYTYRKYVGHSNIVLNSIIINQSIFITYSLDKSIILWRDSTTSYSYQITCAHDSTPGGFILLNFNINGEEESSYLFSFGSFGKDSLNLSVSNIKSSMVQCKQYLSDDFNLPIINGLSDSSSQSIIVYSSAEVVIYGFNQETKNFDLLQKLGQQFFNQKLFSPLQGLQIFQNAMVLFTQNGKFSINSYINNNQKVKLQEIIDTQNFVPIQISMQNIYGTLFDEKESHLYLFGSQIQQINLKNISVNYIITNLPIPFIKHTQSISKTMFNLTQNIFASTSVSGLSFSYDFLTGELISMFLHPDYQGKVSQPQGITLRLLKGTLLCVAYNDQSIVCYHVINAKIYYKQIFIQTILRLFNDDVNGYILINGLDYLQIIDPFNQKIINTINQQGQFYYMFLYPNLNCVVVSQDGYIIKYNYPDLTVKYQTDSSNINTNEDQVVGFAFGSNQEGYSIFYFIKGLAILYDEQLNMVSYSNNNIQINRCGIVQDGKIYLFYICLNQDGTVVTHGIAKQFYSKIQAIQFPIVLGEVIGKYNKAAFSIDVAAYGGILIFADSVTQLAQSQFGSRSKINGFEIDTENQRVFIYNKVGDIMLSHFTPNTYFNIKRSEQSILQKLLLIQSLQKLVSLSNVITIYDYFSNTIYKIHKQTIIDALVIEDIQVIISFNYDVSDNLQIWNFNTDQNLSLVGHSVGVNGVLFVSQQNIILSYDKEGLVITWGYKSDLSQISILQQFSQNSNREIKSLLLFTKYTNSFISLDITGNVQMVNFLNGSIVKAFKVSSTNIRAMYIDESYDRVFFYGTSIEVYSALTGVKIQEIIGFDNIVQQVIFKNNYIIAYGNVNIQSIDRDTLAVLHASQFKKNIYSLTVLMNFVGMVGNNVDSNIEVWDYTSGVMLSEIKNPVYPQNLVSIFNDEQAQLFIVSNVDRYLFTVPPYFSSYLQQKDFLFAKMTSSYIKNYIFDFYSNILIVCNDDTIIAWQYYAYVGFQGQAVMAPSESLIMSSYHSQKDIITYADINQNIWQASQNQLQYKLQLLYQPKQIVLHTNTHLISDGINLYSYDLSLNLVSQLQIYPFSIYIDETIEFIFAQTYNYQIIQLLLNIDNSQLSIVKIYNNHSNRIIKCIINIVYSHIITFDVTGYLAINNYKTQQEIAVPQQNMKIIRDIQIDFQFKRLITCSQDSTSIIFSYSQELPITVLDVIQQSSSVVQAVIDSKRNQILIWTDLQLSIQVRDLNSTKLDLVKLIYGPGDYQTQMKLSQQWNILAVFNQFQVNLHDRNSNDAFINSLRMPFQIYNITDIQFMSSNLLLIRSKAQLNLVSFSYSSINIQKTFYMQFPILLSVSYSDQLIVNIKGINLLSVFNYTFPQSSDLSQLNYSQCYSNLQRTSSYFQLSQDLSTQSISFQKVQQSIQSIILNIQMDDQQPFFFVQQNLDLGSTQREQQFYIYDKKQQSLKDKIDLKISSFEQFNMPTLTLKNFYWKIENQTIYSFNNNTKNIIFVNSTFQENIYGSNFILNGINTFMIDDMEIKNLKLTQNKKSQARALQDLSSQNSSLFQITNSNSVYLKNLSLINLIIEDSISIFQVSQIQSIVIQNLLIQNVTYYSQRTQQNIWSALFQIQNSLNIQINSVIIQNCTTNYFPQDIEFQYFIIFYMNANKNTSINKLTAQYNQDLMIFDASQTYLQQGLGYIKVVNDTISFSEMIVSQSISVLGYALNKIQTDNFNLIQSSFVNNTCLDSYGCAFDIMETKFQFDLCIFLNQKSQYGGAISIRDSPFNNFILNSKFSYNFASQGGSIYLLASNLEMENTIITQNKAEVGGAIRYLKLIPNFIIKKQHINKNLSQNSIENNLAQIFGQNIGSYPRSMKIESIKTEVSLTSIIQNENESEYQIDNFMSGGNLDFNVKIYDEENGIVNLSSLEQSRSDLQSEFMQYQLECISTNSEIQINGNKATFNYDNISYQFSNIQVISNPQGSEVFYIQNNIIQIPNLYNQTQFSSAPLFIKLNVNFRQCEIGEIIIQGTQNTPSQCELCSEQKYSLITPDPSKTEQVCKLCPESCAYCKGKTLILKNGYWRENNYTDNIVSCINNPDNCQGESIDSIQNCKKGYIGPLCETCDLKGKVWNQKFMNKQLYECIPCHDSQTQAFIYLSSLAIGCLYIIFGVKAARQMTLIKAQCYYLRMIGIASIGNSESTDKSDIYLKFYMHFVQISSVAYQIYQPQFLNVFQVGIGTPIDFLKFAADCRTIFTEQFVPHAYGRIIWSQILSISYFTFLVTIYYIMYMVKYFRRFEKSLINTGAIFIFLFLQPNIISGLVQIVSCRDIGGTQYLTADVTLQCFTLEYYSYIIFLFLPLFIIWAVIIPLMWIIILKRKLKILNYCSVRLSYGLLYSEYKKQTYFWEFVKINLKLLIIIISHLYSQQIEFKNTILTLVLFCYLMLSIFKAPYINVNFNRTDQFLCITLIICLQLNLLVNKSENNLQYQICSLLLYTLHYIFSSYLIMQVLLGKTKRILLLIGEKYPFIKSSFRKIYQKLGINSQNKIRTFRNWAKAINLIATHLLNRNNLQAPDSISQIKQGSQFFSKHLRKNSMNINLNTQQLSAIQQKRGISNFKLTTQNDDKIYLNEKKKEENESTLNILEQEQISTLHPIKQNTQRQEDSVLQIFSDRVKKKQKGRKELHQNYQFKTNKNNAIFNLFTQDNS